MAELARTLCHLSGFPGEGPYGSASLPVLSLFLSLSCHPSPGLEDITACLRPPGGPQGPAELDASSDFSRGLSARPAHPTVILGSWVPPACRLASHLPPVGPGLVSPTCCSWEPGTGPGRPVTRQLAPGDSSDLTACSHPRGAGAGRGRCLLLFT